MQVIDNEQTKYPLKIWLDDLAAIEQSCLEQAYHLANLPFIHRHAVLMPDTHTGMGMPIGGVIACEDVIIPNAVGSDIGCGMAFAAADVPVETLREITTGSGNLVQAIIGDILRSIPVGFNHYKTAQPSVVLDQAKENLALYERELNLLGEIEGAYKQIGTLGGGNHFIELQRDDDGLLCVMLHSGSRHLGAEICRYFNTVAKTQNRRWYSQVPEEYGLAFLPVDTQEGQSYLNWMTLALDFAQENRSIMLRKVQAIIERWLSKYDIAITWRQEINCHHNYAALENHFAKKVWVHRKGATRANAGELAVIPGAMGSYSYVVQGLGNKESFCSSSHGAGRLYSRKGAMNAFSQEQVMNDLKAQGVILGKHNKKDVAEESRFAYKAIDEVMKQQQDLVTPVKQLKTIGVVKG